MNQIFFKIVKIIQIELISYGIFAKSVRKNLIWKCVVELRTDIFVIFYHSEIDISIHVVIIACCSTKVQTCTLHVMTWLNVRRRAQAKIHPLDLMR